MLELVRGSPLRILDIVVIYSVVAPHKSSVESLSLHLGKRISKDDTHSQRLCKKIGDKKR